MQGCDFAQLMAVSRTADILARLPAGDSLIEVKDFRLVTLDDDPLGRCARSESRTEADYVRFDLADDSLLEPITSDEAPFRVTMYDPRALDETHRRGRHRYLVARELIEADVVFNVPKLKTHKKAGVTGALKNLVGINGHKGLPAPPSQRRRRAGRRRVSRQLDVEDVRRRSVRHRQSPHRRPDQGGAVPIGGAPRARRESDTAPAGVEGSWHGNNTVWRMSLDLQRLLRYGRIDGTMADAPARENHLGDRRHHRRRRRGAARADATPGSG